MTHFIIPKSTSLLRSEFQSQLVEFRTQLDSKVNCDINII